MTCKAIPYQSAVPCKCCRSLRWNGSTRDSGVAVILLQPVPVPSFLTCPSSNLSLIPTLPLLLLLLSGTFSCPRPRQPDSTYSLSFVITTVHIFTSATITHRLLECILCNTTTDYLCCDKQHLVYHCLINFISYYVSRADLMTISIKLPNTTTYSRKIRTEQYT